MRAHRYPLARGARRGPFAIEARYDDGLRLTWPEALADVREASGAPYGRALVARGSALRIHVAGHEVVLGP